MNIEYRANLRDKGSSSVIYRPYLHILSKRLG